MDDTIKKALDTDRLIDITTIGRKTGQPHRIEIGFHRVEGELFICGTPGPRGWLANLKVNPEFVFHLKQSVEIDLSATAIPIFSESDRRSVFTTIAERRQGRRPMVVEEWVQSSPLVKVLLH